MLCMYDMIMYVGNDEEEESNHVIVMYCTVEVNHILY